MERLDFTGDQAEEDSIAELAEFSLHSIFGGMEGFFFYLSLIIMELVNSRGSNISIPGRNFVHSGSASLLERANTLISQ